MVTLGTAIRASEIIGASASELRDKDFLNAFNYWDKLRAQNVGPSWKVYDLLQLPTKLIPCVLVMDCKTEPVDFLYRFWGTGFTGVHNQNLTNQSVKSVVPKELGELFFEQNRKTLEARKPCLFVNQITAPSGIRGFATNETIVSVWSPPP